MLKLFIKDRETGVVHEYGTNPHDSLIVHSDGSLSYYNLQTGEGTMFGAYCFCDKNGNDPMDKAIKTHWAVMPFVDIAGKDDDLISFIDAYGDRVKDIVRFVSEIAQDICRIADGYKKQGYTYEEILAILTAPDEEDDVTAAGKPSGTEAKIGHWESRYTSTEEGFLYNECSVCGYETGARNFPPKCPNCGANMKGAV